MKKYTKKMHIKQEKQFTLETIAVAVERERGIKKCQKHKDRKQ